MGWHISVLKNYATFEGRARRKEYWMFILFNIIALVALSLLSQIADILTFLVLVYVLGVSLLSLAVAVRRMRDTGKSGWFN